MPNHSKICRACLESKGAFSLLKDSHTLCPECGSTLSLLTEKVLTALKLVILKELDHPETPPQSMNEEPHPFSPSTPLVIEGRIRILRSQRGSRSSRPELVISRKEAAKHAEFQPGPLLRVLWAQKNPDRQPLESWVRLGSSGTNPFYVRAKAETSKGRVSVAELLNDLGYREGDPIALTVLDDKPTLFIARHEKGNTRPPDTFETALNLDPLVLDYNPPTWLPKQAGLLLRRYAKGSYKGEKNIDLDKKAYRIFSDGLDMPFEDLVTCLVFLGKYYGGAQERYLKHGLIDECRLIAQDLHKDLPYYKEVLASIPPLEQGVASPQVLDKLLRPFHQTRYWLSWGSKFLHFLKPEGFALLDPAIETALGIKRRLRDPGYFHGYLAVMREIQLKHSQILRNPPPQYSETPPLKVLDDILWAKSTTTN